MRVAYMLDNATPWNSGIWFHRVKSPTESLMLRGHTVKQFAIGKERPSKEILEWPDVVIFGRTYPDAFNPIEDMKAFKKAGKRVVWDFDDDLWAVEKNNPSVLVSSVYKDQYEGMIREADAITTPSPILAKKVKKLCKGKPVFICPNAINFEDYKERPRVARGDDVFVGYMAASSHYDDMAIAVDAMEILSQKYPNVFFYLYGLTAEPFEAAIYNVRKILQNNLQPEKEEVLKSMLETYDKFKNIRLIHKPFMPPEIHPMILASLDFDIGIAPLVDNEFNHGKSCIKMYEYAATGTCTLSSDVLPYSDEVSYRAKNTVKDWVAKLEKLIVDKPFREKLQMEQSKWVRENRSIEKVGVMWEKACQLPGGLKVSSQS
jgi:glycosyltransferase involved in cell wall biosynthesis